MPLPIIQSGYINTGSNTPTGQPKQIAVDNPYITKDDFIASIEASGLGIDATSDIYTNGQLDTLILNASAWFNRMCNMYFDTQTIDETKTAFTVKPYNPQLTTVVLSNRPYSRINSCYIQVLKWFVEVDVTSPASYIQDFYDFGYFKIVPLLSSSGQGTGSPIPSEIIDRIALGVLWYNYTFGYGQPLTSIPLAQPSGVTDMKTFQAPVGYRLIAPSQTLNVYIAGVLQNPSTYSVSSYPNAIIAFTNTISGAVTADYITNQSIPADMKEAVILLCAYILGEGSQNSLGANSYSIQTYSVNFGSDESKVVKRVRDIVQHYTNNTPKFL